MIVLQKKRKKKKSQGAEQESHTKVNSAGI